MIGRALKLDWENIPEEIENYVSASQTFIESGKDYTVHAVSVYKGLVFFLVIDDLNSPVFLPARLFKVVNTAGESDWICNSELGLGVALVIGPDFIAKDLSAYNAMVDQESSSVAKLEARLSTP